MLGARPCLTEQSMPRVPALLLLALLCACTRSTPPAPAAAPAPMAANGATAIPTHGYFDHTGRDDLLQASVE